MTREKCWQVKAREYCRNTGADPLTKRIESVSLSSISREMMDCGPERPNADQGIHLWS